MRQQRHYGFTLIELMVVISIISLLASIILASMNSARAKARDARRLHDLRQIETALALFYDKFGKYPCGDAESTYGDTLHIGVDSSGSTSFLNGHDGDPSTYCTEDDQDTGDGYIGLGLTTEGFISNLYQYNDPLAKVTIGFNYRYWYFVDNPRQKYVLTAGLETGTNAMQNDGGSCPKRYEVGNGLPRLDPNFPINSSSYDLKSQGQCAGTPYP